jgi:hypothetical protein
MNFFKYTALIRPQKSPEKLTGKRYEAQTLGPEIAACKLEMKTALPKDDPAKWPEIEPTTY